MPTMARAYVLAVLVALNINQSVSASGMLVKLNRSSCSYSLSMEGVEWAISRGIAVHNGGKWYSSEAQKASATQIQLVTILDRNGSSTLGKFQAVDCVWQLADATHMVTTIEYYPDSPDVLVFEHAFQEGLYQANTGTDGVPISAFPAFDTQAAKMSELGYVAAHHIFGNIVHGVGLKDLSGDTQGGSPLVLFDTDAIAQGPNMSMHSTSGDTSEARVAVVFSPANHFKVGIQTLVNGSSDAFPQKASSVWVAGFNGLVDNIDNFTTLRTIAVAGTSIHNAMHAWGGALLTIGQKRAPVVAPSSARPLDDVTATSLSYWTGTTMCK